MEPCSSDDEQSVCERGGGSSVETESLTNETSLASSFSHDTLEDCITNSPAKIRRLRLRRGGIPVPFNAPSEINFMEEELLLKRDTEQAELLFLHEDSPRPSLERQIKISKKYLYSIVLAMLFLSGVFQIASTVFRPTQWLMPSRRRKSRLIQKINLRSMKAVGQEAGLTIRLTGSRIDLLYQSLETHAHCNKVNQIQIDWKATDETVPVPLLSHSSQKVVATSTSTKLETDAVLLLEENVHLTCQDMARALQQWQLDPTRIVGFLPDKSRIFSQLSDHAAIVHRYYLSNRPTRRIDDDPCWHFTLSTYITAVSEKAPVLITSNLIQNQRFNDDSRCLAILSQASGMAPMQAVATRYVGRHS